MGYISTISTKIEQILCSSGYSDQLAGTAGSSILFCGFLASFPMGLISYKTKKPILVCKLSGFVVLSSLVMIGYFMRLPDKKAEIIVSCVLLGIFALGPYPVALELLVECTYPLDQAIGTAFIFLSSALQGVLLMELENHISSDLSKEKMEIQTCVDPSDHGHQQPKDYSNYLNFITVYMLLLGLLFMLFFKTEMKRTNADDSSKKAQIMSDPENQGTVEETESLATAKIA
jgi:FLVCR family MFS transporter 7